MNDVKEWKACLVGDMGVGKTSIITRFKDNAFFDDQPMTIGTAFASAVITVDGITHKMAVWDTAGQERFRSLAPLYYRGIAAAIIVYDVTQRHTFDSLCQYWLTSIRSHSVSEGREIVTCIVGNKADLKQDREVTQDEVETFASAIGAIFVESSAKSGENIDQIFEEIARRVGMADDKKQAKSATSIRTSQTATLTNNMTSRETRGTPCCS